MLSGLQLFDSVDEGLSHADREVQAAQQEAEALATQRDRARAVEAQALRDLVRLRLTALRSGGEAAVGQLDAAEGRVRGLLAERAEALRAADAALGRQHEAVQAAQAERERRAGALRALEAAQVHALSAAQETARADPEWQRLRAAAEEAARIATLAAQKAALAHQDLTAKGQPYRDDPLFTYLWERGFGTARYRAGPLTRMLDRWTARVAAYEPARRNFALLSELPGRLDAHAERMREKAAAAAGNLAAAERRLAGLPEEDSALKGAHEALDMAEQALEAARAASGQAETQRASLAAGQDEAMRQAEAQLEAALGTADLRSLREAARRTPTQEDDNILARLEAAAAERAHAEQELVAIRASLEAAQRRRAEVESLRQEMRSRGYRSDRWDFKDGALVGVLIGELLRGALSRDGFWDRMRRHRVPGGGPGGPWGAPPGPWGGPPGPWDGGSGAGGSPWPMPGPWGIPDRRDGGGFGGGGFRTGGSIGGGGGFRTGGSF